jgi:hypothetical protein
MLGQHLPVACKCCRFVVHLTCGDFHRDILVEESRVDCPGGQGVSSANEPAPTARP